MVALTVLYAERDGTTCFQLNKVAKAWWNPEQNTVTMGYGYSITEDSVGYAKARVKGINLDRTQLDTIATMMKSGEMRKHLDNWIMTGNAYTKFLIGEKGDVVDMKLYGHQSFGRQIGFEQDGRWMSISYYILKSLMEDVFKAEFFLFPKHME